jgi:type II secretory pathway component GspD/PulD (secretin)
MRPFRFVIAVSLAVFSAFVASFPGAPSATAAPSDTTSAVLSFPNTDVNEVLSLYESLTHFKIIRDNFVQGKIMIMVAEPVPRDKAVEIIERTLFADGFAIIQIDSETVEIVGAGHNARGIGIPTISDPKQIPPGERLVSYFFQFKHADAAKVANLFAQYLSPPKSYTSFLQPAGVNALWVTERTSVIRQLLVAAEKIDVPQQDQRKP